MLFVRDCLLTSVLIDCLLLFIRLVLLSSAYGPQPSQSPSQISITQSNDPVKSQLDLSVNDVKLLLSTVIGRHYLYLVFFLVFL